MIFTFQQYHVWLLGSRDALLRILGVRSKYRTERENFYLKISNKYQNFNILHTFAKYMYIMKNANQHFANFINVLRNKYI